MASPDLTELVKLALRPRYSFALWVCAVIILAVPLPDFLRLQDFRTEYGKFLGVVAVLTFVVWVVELAIVLGAKKRDEWHVIAHLDGLNPEELAILGKAVGTGHQTINCQCTRGNVQSLVAKRMFDPAGQPNKFEMQAHTVPLFLWRYLNKPKHGFLVRAKAANPSLTKELDKPA
jgi:hypothetical protein